MLFEAVRLAVCGRDFAAEDVSNCWLSATGAVGAELEVLGGGVAVVFIIRGFSGIAAGIITSAVGLSDGS